MKRAKAFKDEVRPGQEVRIVMVPVGYFKKRIEDRQKASFRDNNFRRS
jgi:uncharacterized protein YbgA (DUF1722 family)